MADIKGVIFDFYGTLVSISNKKSYRRLFYEMGLGFSDEYKEAHRVATTENFEDLSGLVNRLKPSAEIDLTLFNEDIQQELDSVSIYPESLTVLSKLKERNLKLGLISNVSSPYKKPFFDLGLDKYFDEVVFSCDVGFRKPDLEIYQIMIDYIKINSKNLFMVGDTLAPDVSGPILAGMNAVHLDRSKTSLNSISNLEEIFEYL